MSVVKEVRDLVLLIGDEVGVGQQIDGLVVADLIGVTQTTMSHWEKATMRQATEILERFYSKKQ